MRVDQALNFFLGASVLFVWFIRIVHWSSIPVQQFPSIVDSIPNNGGQCPFDLTLESDLHVEELHVVPHFWNFEFGTLTLGSFVDKLQNIANVERFIKSQLSCFHVLEEILFCSKLWISLICIIICYSCISSLFFSPFLSFIPESDRQEIEKSEANAKKFGILSFGAEKALFLSFVVTRSETSIRRQKMMAAGYVKGVPLPTDITVFAIWGLLFYAIMDALTTIERRVQLCEKYEVKENLKRVFLTRLMLLAFCCLCGASSMFSLSASTGNLIHPMYSVIILLEATLLVQRSGLELARLSASILRLKTPEISVKKAQYWVSVTSHFTSAIVLALYITIGVAVNGKFMAIVFIPLFTLEIIHLTRQIFYRNPTAVKKNPLDNLLC